MYTRPKAEKVFAVVFSTQLSVEKIVVPCFKRTFPARICSSVPSASRRNSSLRTPGKISTDDVVSPRGDCPKEDREKTKQAKRKNKGLPVMDHYRGIVSLGAGEVIGSAPFFPPNT